MANNSSLTSPGNNNSNHINYTLNAKGKLAAPTSSIKITPANSPVLKPASRTPYKSSSYQSTLSLQSVIGTTTSNPNGFSCHEPTKTFALCAGSAAILAELDENLAISQRFFRARPSATAINPVISYYSTPPATPDSRLRSTKGVGNGTHYPPSPNGEMVESNGSRAWSSRGRVKAVTSVSLSPNGRFLAVGETGYSPRVLIFSTAKDSPLDIPLSILMEHTFGVRSIAFSPNSQCLATLGDINDGFLYIWAISLRNGAAKLHSTNKCTAFVRDMCWMGKTLVTVGIRHVKVWRVGDSAPSSPSKQRLSAESPAPSTNPTPIALSGRNCLLGSLNNTTFTCISKISDSEAIICSDTGAICFLNDNSGQQRLSFIKDLDFGICSSTVDHSSGLVWFGGRDRLLENYSIEDLRSLAARPPGKSLIDLQQSPKPRKPAVVSMGIIDSHLIAVDSTRTIRVCPLNQLDKDNIESVANVSMSAHRDSVLGISPISTANTHSADFFTWSCGGMVRFWDLQGKCSATMKVDLEQLSGNDDETNELKVLRATESIKTFISGDKYGVIRTINGETWKCITEVRAHGGEVTDIAIQSSSETILIASCGRDRMVQLFTASDQSIELIQTMDEHVGAVGRLLFANNGEKLLSSSADRTVIIRERVAREVDGVPTAAFILSKVITLKTSPLSITIPPGDSDILVISTIDRHVQKYDISSAKQIHSFRVLDPESGDSAVLSSLTVGHQNSEQSPKLLVGVSTTDKSIRVYDFEKDTLLTREFGHTEGVSDVILLGSNQISATGQVRKTLISSGLDGVIMVWNLSIQQQHQQQQQLQDSPLLAIHGEEDTPSKELTAIKPPLRRILSRSELAGFQKTDSAMSSPTPARETSPPRIRKKTSRLALGSQSSKNGHNNTPTVPTPPLPPPRRSPTSIYHPNGKNRRDGSVSPPSPKLGLRPRALTSKTSIGNLRRPSIIDARSRPNNNNNKSSGNTSISNSEFGSLNMSTEQVCRTLRAYRKKINGSTGYLHSATELEKELDLTVRALGERAKKVQLNGDHQITNGNGSRAKEPPSLPSRPVRLARRMPSTPNLGRGRNGKSRRTNSLDADGEG